MVIYVVVYKYDNGLEFVASTEQKAKDWIDKQHWDKDIYQVWDVTIDEEIE